MKLMLVVCAAATCLSLASTSPRQQVGRVPTGQLDLPLLAQSQLNLAMVRMDYSDWSGNHDHTDTTCHIVNTSSKYIKLDKIYVLGEGGVTSVLAVSNKFAGKVLPPLAHVQFLVDKSISGVRPQTVRTLPSIAQNVVATWSGPDDALRLTAVIRRIAPGNNDNRTVYQVEGKILSL